MVSRLWMRYVLYDLLPPGVPTIWGKCLHENDNDLPWGTLTGGDRDYP